MNSSRLIVTAIRSAKRIGLGRYYCSHAAPLEVPSPDGTEKTYSPHITEIVDKISQLTLMEVADLNSCLKARLNIPDAPVMAMGMPMAGMATPSAQPQEEEEEVKQVQTLFTVKLDKFEESKKIAVIKEVKKLMDGMNLVQAKKFVESAPAIVKEDLSKEEAEAMKKALEAVGASAVIE